MSDLRPSPPSWRTPEVWLVVGLPIACLVAIALTLRIAGNRVDVARSDVQRVAQIQVEDLGADREAARRGLRATLALDAAGRVEVTLAAVDPTDALALDFIHPVDATLDRSIVLQQANDIWSGRVVLPSAMAWHVRLAPASSEWRLVGQVRSASATVLAPAVAHP